jgi:hypothetical protein
MNAVPDFRRIVVHEPDRTVAAGRMVAHFPHNHGTGIPGADDQHPLPVGPKPTRFPNQPGKHSQPGQQAPQQQGVDDKNGGWIGSRTQPESHHPGKSQRADGDTQRKITEVPQTGVPPDAVIEPEGVEGERPDDQQQRKHRHEQVPFLRRNVSIEAKQKCHPVRKRSQSQVAHKQQQAPLNRGEDCGKQDRHDSVRTRGSS